ncbi:MAG: acyl carrier protein [Isosphaeraceae bacterium]
MSSHSAIDPMTGDLTLSSPHLNDEIHGKVIAELLEVFRNRKLIPPALGPETVLDASLGLESLDFAELVVRLEQVFGRDPFAQGAIPEIVTIRDLASLYR